MGDDGSEVLSTSFLWKPYRREYAYWEVVECLRRLMLTGVLVFILPGDPGQSVYACVFAYASIMVYMRCQPHHRRLDGWLYALGATVLFLSMFVALVVQAGFAASGEDNGDVVSVLLIILNVLSDEPTVTLVLLGAALAQICLVSQYLAPLIKKRPSLSYPGRRPSLNGFRKTRLITASRREPSWNPPTVSASAVEMDPPASTPAPPPAPAPAPAPAWAAAAAAVFARRQCSACDRWAAVLHGGT
ncbi:hypothetical protein JKP88DRAFT_274888 [Tribonema minus]|uniref:Uncharacterized protein n=1 Tax=Tribonema minus TaxID=303371 RepID=A0A835ZGU5_9STRA|nr:hypothetical protein JKP88DRAFT_274888 [Tribonema minus]